MKNTQITFYPMHVHLHASHEPSASIGSHMSRAATLGIKHIWITEHDTRMGQKGRNAKDAFFFSEENLFIESLRAGFLDEEENTGAHTFERTKNGIVLHMQAKRDEKQSLLFYSKGKWHCDALFARLKVRLNADMVLANEQASVIVEFVLSAQPPSYKQARLRYVLGKMPKEEALTQCLPMPEKQDGAYDFPISKDVSEAIGGLDNALCNVRLTVQGGATLTFRSFAFERELNFEQVRQEQIKIARRLGEKWGVTAFSCFEITGAGHHKNCYGTHVPVIDYIAEDFRVNNENAIAHVKAHGGIFSWNHPFTEVSAKGLPQEERKALAEQVTEALIENRVHGATMMEVGFPVGRDGFNAQYYLQLWDKLATSGVFITGDGDSDNHGAAAAGWTEGNNFCTYAGVESGKQPTEQAFVQAFRRGLVWFGNPVLMRNFAFRAKHAEMGEVLIGKRVRVRFSSTDIQCGGYARCIVNGEEVKRIAVKKGKVAGGFVLTCKEKYNFARVELYTDDDLLMASTNPIYMVSCAQAVPKEAIENGRTRGQV